MSQEPYDQNKLPEPEGTPIQVFSPAEIRRTLTAKNDDAMKHMQKVVYALTFISLLLAITVICLGIYAASTVDDDDNSSNSTSSGIECTGKYFPSTWQEIIPSSSQPHGRLAHAATSDGGNKMYIHGGLYGNNETVFGDLWVYDEAKDMWEELTTSGDVPSARFHHSLTMTDDKKHLFLYGGFNTFNAPVNPKHQAYDDFYRYDISTKVWTRLDQSLAGGSAKPGAHGAHDTIYVNNAVFMFGGFPVITATGHKAEMWKYVPAENKWFDLTPANTTYPNFPDGRIGFAFTKIDGGKAMIWGGGCEPTATHSTTGQCDDTWIYDYSLNSWQVRHPDTHQYSPKARRATHGDVSIGGIVFMFGGVHISVIPGSPPTPQIEMMNDLHAYDPQQDKWMPIFPNYGRGSMPPITFGHSVTRLGNKVVIFGGRAGSPAHPGSNQLWEYNVVPPVDQNA